MINTEIRVIKLACVNCGSNLNITQQMNRLACGYCGTQQIVERTGGAIHLRGVAEALSKVQAGTDKTAAELAIARISKELEAIRYHRVEKEQYWIGVKAQKVYAWDTFLKGKESTVTSTTLVVGIVATIPWSIIASVFYKIAAAIIPYEEKAILPAAIIFLVGWIGSAVMFARWMSKNDKYNPKKFQDERNKELVTLDRQIAADLGEIDKKIFALNNKLQQNYQIANS